MQTNMPDEYREKIKRILDDERWKGYVSGKARRASLGGCSRGEQYSYGIGCHA